MRVEGFDEVFGVLEVAFAGLGAEGLAEAEEGEDPFVDVVPVHAVVAHAGVAVIFVVVVVVCVCVCVKEFSEYLLN